jgi:hypothetical protein
MNLDPAPRLNKAPFFITAAVCFTVFLLIGLLAPNRFDTLPLVIAVSFLLLSITAIMVPLITDFSADSAEYIQAERSRITEQTQRLHNAAESLARAAAQIKTVEEAVHKSAHAAENLPYRMQEKLAEFNEALAAKDTEDRDALERELDELRAANSDQLKAIADKLARATTEWTAIEAATRKQLAAVQDSSAKLSEQFKSNLADLDTRIAALAKAVAGVPVVAAAPAAPTAAPISAGEPEVLASAPAGRRPDLPAEPAESSTPAEEPPAAVAPTASEPLPAIESSSSPIESVTLSEETPTPSVSEPKAKKPRAPRKPKPEETLAAMSTEPAVEAAPEVAPVAAVVESDPVVESPAKPESAASSDGATRLLVTAYIGIGNKLFIRGDGPGLSWDKGVPMQFVSIGKWGWASHDITAPIACKLYKNDETAALSGEVLLEPGKHVELTALF